MDQTTITMTRAWKQTAPRDGVEQRTMNLRLISVIGKITQTFTRRNGEEGSRDLPLVFAIAQMEGDTRVFSIQQPMNDWIFPRIGEPLVGLDVTPDGQPIDANELVKQAAQNAQQRLAPAGAAAASNGTSATLDDLLPNVSDEPAKGKRS